MSTDRLWPRNPVETFKKNSLIITCVANKAQTTSVGWILSLWNYPLFSCYFDVSTCSTLSWNSVIAEELRGSEVIVSTDCMKVRVYNCLWIFLIKLDHQVLNGRKWWPCVIIRSVDHECQFKKVMVKVKALLEPIVSGGIALQIGSTNSYYLGNIFQVIFPICKYHFCDLQIPLIFNFPVFLFNYFNHYTIPESQLLYLCCNVQL